MLDFILGKRRLRENTVKLMGICDELFIRTGGKYSSRLTASAWLMISDNGNMSRTKHDPALCTKIKALKTLGDVLDLYTEYNSVVEDKLRIELGATPASWSRLRAKKLNQYHKDTGMGI